MLRKRPCRCCRRWFLPHRQAGDRQKFCSLPSCRRERHRRSCKRWHDKNPDYDREDRFRKKLEAELKSREDSPDPVRQLPLDTARDAVGMKGSVIIEESIRVLSAWARDAVRTQGLDTTK